MTGDSKDQAATEAGGAQPPARARRLSRGKVVVYSLLPLAVLLVTLEAAARVAEMVWPPLPADIGLSFSEDSRLFTRNPLLKKYMVTHPNKSTVPDSVKEMYPEGVPVEFAAPFLPQRFELPKPPRRFRIFIVGESSVQSAGQQFERMAARLSQQFGAGVRFEVINCGGSAYGSHRLSLIVNEILEYEPDLVCLYLGNNEFEEKEQLKRASLDTLPLQRLLWSSAAMRFLRDRVVLAQLEAQYAEYNRKILSQSKVVSRTDWPKLSKEEIDSRMDSFKSNLELMVTRIQARGVPVIIGTIPSNLIRPNLRGEDAERFSAEAQPKYDQGRFAEGAAITQEILAGANRNQSSAQELKIIREVATEYSVPLADVEAAVIAAEPHGVPGETLYSDHCHLNEAGKEILARVFEEKIAAIAAIRLGQKQ